MAKEVYGEKHLRSRYLFVGELTGKGHEGTF